MSQFNGYSFQQLFELETLNAFDQQFLNALDPELKQKLLAYRQQTQDFSPLEISELLIACAPTLEQFLAQLFDIEFELAQLKGEIEANNPILQFKKWFVLRRARRRLNKKDELTSFEQLDKWLEHKLACNYEDKELATAKLGLHYLDNKDSYKDEIEQLTQWCIQAIKTEQGRKAVQSWISFNLPQHTDPQNLVSLISAQAHCQQAPQHCQREGFDLTDNGMSLRQVQGEIHYCLFCHDHDGDSCSKGFLVKKGELESGFRQDALQNTLTGCPLGEKISEMHALKRDGYNLGALAMVMVDNPMCPATGHRICNECMKACVYQKQTPVNIPQIETRVLKDVLHLPYGIEIYDLLTRWNPLRQTQFLPQAYNGLKVLIAGQGPAGFTLAHHLLMQGFAVVGVDGLKIEPVSKELLKKPIKNYTDIEEDLSKRITLGFGGVAEYGITVRWDKNYLKLIYLSLLRRSHYQVFGNVRFGGTVTVEDAWALGFDHLAVAVGAGLPQALPIENSLATGMRQANDFLMALQLTGAAKTDSLANLQIRLPAVVIGGGLTAIDTATEVQAYYLVQIEKIAKRYTELEKNGLKDKIWSQLTATEQSILQQFLDHAQQLKELKQQAEQLGVEPDTQSLIHQWGGVTIVYRRSLQESPAYTRNHEEVIQALEEGIYYAQGFEPKAVKVDIEGHATGLTCIQREQDADGKWQVTDNEVTFAANTILVATGAKTNIAYEFEHRGTFERVGFEYQPYQLINGELQKAQATEHCKQSDFGAFTSYQHQSNKVTFLGDTHPAFHGNVVKAIASAQKVYPHIVQALADEKHDKSDLETEYQQFKARIQDLFTAKLTQIETLSDNVLRLHIYAPMAAQKFEAGQFFRIQNFETDAPIIHDTKLQMEAIAVLGAGVNEQEIQVIVVTQGASSRLCHQLQVGQQIALMGPTGAKARVKDENEAILFIGGQLAIPEVLAVGKALKQKGNKVIFLATFDQADKVFCHQELLDATDQIIWNVRQGKLIKPQRSQDQTFNSDVQAILQQHDLGVDLKTVSRVIVLGGAKLVNLIQSLRQNELKKTFSNNTQFSASTFSTMQCMLKGVCAQCLQWQVDPETGKRTKAVFACSWQQQPMELIDVPNLNERLRQNRVSEVLNAAWLDYVESL
ncbi:FAD-dependent oxidoreductase [Candidatus Albibeggiatoa sp. nov. NOAA]|uniref:FAD-dependent oxidoreductase n=1 Tax=Candidatus Albibeggiatoa sp. nov. NOAA TaxID=3162724 RepID=UPI0032F46D59|nr:FAD-dependent oxidoreductase [Thiotrichaceae bacterium]